MAHRFQHLAARQDLGKGSGLNRILFLVSCVQHFDQAIFQFETFVQQATQFLEFLCDAFSRITQIIEREQLLGDDVDARIDCLGQLQAALVVESLGFPVSCS